MAAGNYSPACSTVQTTPAVFANSVSVRATDAYNYIVLFHSRGPVTVDGSGRLKPEIVAPGKHPRRHPLPKYAVILVWNFKGCFPHCRCGCPSLASQA
jgi:hypothetical protein